MAESAFKKEKTEIHPPSHFRAGTRENLEKQIENNVHYEPKHLKKVAENGVYALERADNLMRQVEEVRKQNLQNPTRTEIGNKAVNYEFGMKKDKELASMLEKEEQKLRDVVSGIDESMEREMGKLAETGSYAKETRSIVRNMEDESARTSFVREKIINEDWQTVEEILGAPRPHLIGISERAQESLSNMYKERRYSDRLKTQEVLKEIADKMGDGYRAATETFREVLENEDVKEAIKQRDHARQLMNE